MAASVRKPRWPLLQHPLAIAFGVIVMYAVLQASAQAYLVFLLVFLAVLLAVIFSFPVDLLARWIPRGLAVIALLLMLIGTTLGAAVLAVPVVVTQAKELVKRIPEATSRADQWFSTAKTSEAMSQVPGAQKVADNVADRAASAMDAVLGKLAPAALNVVSGSAAVILLVFLAAFLVYQPDSYRRGLRALVPREHEDAFEETWRRLGNDLKQWVGGILVAMALMGTLTGVGLAVVGIKAWLLLGLITFFATFVPYVGAVASAIPGLIVGLSQSPRHFGLALLVYIVVHIVEGYLVEPLVMRRAVKLRPASLLVWQAFLGAVFGLMGTVVATPLLVCVRSAVTHLYVERKLGKTEPDD
jgi:predicted PurR-regulated permease PerM